MHKLMKSKGFTLIELVIVMTLIGILVAIALPQFQDLSTKARTNVRQATLGAVRSTFAIYLANNDGSYPTLTALGEAMIPQATAATGFTNDDGTGLQFQTDDAADFIVNTFTDVTCTTATGAGTDTVRCVKGVNSSPT